MFSWNDKTVCPIGIDIGTHSVKVLQFRRRNGQLTLQAAGSAEVGCAPGTDPATRLAKEREALQRVLGTGRFTGRKCVTALPAGMVFAKSIRLPPMPDADLAQAVRWEAGDRLGFDISKGQLAFFRAGEVRRGTEVREELLLFAANADALDPHIGMISSLGLKIKAIDLQPCATMRAVERTRPANAGQITAVIDIGAGGTSLVMAHGDQMVFYKHIDIGASMFDATVAKRLDLPVAEAAQMRRRLAARLESPTDDASDEDALEQAVIDAIRPSLEDLAKELDMCMRYYVVTFRGTRPETVWLTGGEAGNARVREAIGATLGVACEAAQPLAGVQGLDEHTRPTRSGDWAVAAGLSLYDTTPAPLGAGV